MTIEAKSISRNQQEYGDRYAQLTWLTPDQAVAAQARREALLLALSDSVQFGCKGTKLDCRSLSPGCVSCGQGTWSCLFINNKCPCGCFYCPTEQKNIDTPTSNSLRFTKPAEYVGYLERFGFKGMSVSGGEPFLTLNTTIDYIAAARRKFGDKLYIWLYTSGVFADADKLKKLRDVGVDEIRFNIGATQYSLEQARKAVSVIPRVTVEIPAVPEKFELLKEKIREISDAGVNYLNLHQLRLTPHNFEQLRQRSYTFLHGEKVTVLESELTALGLIHHAVTQRIELPINYCSFVYKHRYQQAAFRRRNAALIRKPYEDITESGYLRACWLAGDPAALAPQAERLAYHSPAVHGQWSLSTEKNKLYVAESLWPLMESNQTTRWLRYSEAVVLPQVTYRHNFIEVLLTKNKTIFIEKRPTAKDIAISPQIFRLLQMKNLKVDGANQRHLGPNNDQTEESELWKTISAWETIPPALQPYF